MASFSTPLVDVVGAGHVLADIDQHFARSIVALRAVTDELVLEGNECVVVIVFGNFHSEYLCISIDVLLDIIIAYNAGDDSRRGNY